MKDRNGKTLQIGDIVMYCLEGEIRSTTHGVFKIATIVDDQPKPFATLYSANLGRVMSAPFYSGELHIPEPEELI
jgi:hypothetical protein